MKQEFRRRKVGFNKNEGRAVDRSRQRGGRFAAIVLGLFVSFWYRAKNAITVHLQSIAMRLKKISSRSPNNGTAETRFQHSERSI